ncbi:MAG: RNA-binding domain-containing protein, partial [Nitrososphaerales archaeon]
MKEVPNVALDVRLECQVNPSEDPAKVLRAVKNVVSNCSPEVADGRIRVASKNPEVLITIYEQIRSRRVMGVFRKVLLRNMIANSTWFYLNKQAAFVGTVSI